MRSTLEGLYHQRHLAVSLILVSKTECHRRTLPKILGALLRDSPSTAILTHHLSRRSQETPPTTKGTHPLSKTKTKADIRSTKASARRTLQPSRKCSRVSSCNRMCSIQALQQTAPTSIRSNTGDTMRKKRVRLTRLVGPQRLLHLPR